MKLGRTKQTIDAYADGLQAADAGAAAASLRAIASLLGQFSGEQMSTLLLRGKKVLTATTCASNTSGCGAVAVHLEHLAEILTSGGAKAESTKDLAGLSKLLRAFDESETLSAALEKLRDAMKPEPVDRQINRFIERLKSEKGTAAFEHAFEELVASELKREDVVAIAMSVYGSIKKSSSRKAALDYIRKPHDAYVSAKRGIDATGGRSAA